MNKKQQREMHFAATFILMVISMVVGSWTAHAGDTVTTGFTLKKGKSVQIQTVLKNSKFTSNIKAKNYTWTSRKKKVVKVKKGKIYAKKKGSTDVVGKVSGKVRVRIRVQVGKPSTKVKLNYTKKTVNCGTSLQLRAKVYPKKAKNRKVRYLSSNPSIATVSEKGLVQFVGGGSVRIYACADDSCSYAIFKGKVRAPLTRLTHTGSVKGKVSENAALCWLGVPYAKPPVGELRWRAPQACDTWTGIRLTTRYASCATQLNSSGNVIGSEDCLYLNIWRPNTAEENLPVMVYLHGGGNVTGDATKDFSLLARKANCVIIAVEYRLGGFGWLSMEALHTGNAEEDSGNFAMLDIKKALEWVQINGGAFGGDIHNVTLSGFSAGARNVLACTISPIMKGLFHKVVCFSGGTATVKPEEGEVSAQSKLASILVKRNMYTSKKNALAFIKEAEDWEIRRILLGLTQKEVASMYNYTALRMSNTPQLFRDGTVIPSNGFQVVASGNYQAVPMLFGSNAQEFATYAMSSLYYEKGVDSTAFGTGWSILELLEDAKTFGSQFQAACYAERNAELFLSNSNQPNVYCYRMKWGNRANVAGSFYSRFIGAEHGLDFQFLCGSWNNAYVQYEPNLFSEDNLTGREALSANMQEYLGHFLRTGNPNGKGLSTWNRWSATTDKEKLMIFDANKTTDLSEMSTEYLTSDSITKRMKNSISDVQYKLLMDYILDGRYFMPGENTSAGSEEELLDDSTEGLSENVYDKE